jgi:hypothetical protein
MMLVATDELDDKFDVGARLALDKCPRACEGRAARPAGTRFVARTTVGGEAAVIDFVGRAAFQRRVRARIALPADEVLKLTVES